MVKRIELVPESVRTEVVQHRVASASGLPKRMMVTIGDDYALEKRYVLLGSVRQVDNWTTQGEGYNEEVYTDENYTIEALFRNQSHLLADSLLSDDSQQLGVEDIAARFREEDRKHLLEGPFAVPSRPGSLSIIVDESIGVWAAAEVAFGGNWKIIDVGRPAPQPISPALQDWFRVHGAIGDLPENWR